MTHKDRKERPVYSGVLRYFPLALQEVAYCSWKGNEQHNPGEPLYWNRSKSTDEADALMRHLLEVGKIDSDGVRHTVKVAWRALALLEKELEAVKHFESMTIPKIVLPEMEKAPSTEVKRAHVMSAKDAETHRAEIHRLFEEALNDHADPPEPVQLKLPFEDLEDLTAQNRWFYGMREAFDRPKSGPQPPAPQEYTSGLDIEPPPNPRFVPQPGLAPARHGAEGILESALGPLDGALPPVSTQARPCERPATSPGPTRRFPRGYEGGAAGEDY